MAPSKTQKLGKRDRPLTYGEIWLRNQQKDKFRVAKRSKKPKKPSVDASKRFDLGRLPAELQQMVWGNVIVKPACHTFKIRTQLIPGRNGGWSIHVMPLPEHYDPSAYRLWKKLHSLKNIGFETAFRLKSQQIQPISLKTKGQKYELAAAIDAPTDLIILEFARGRTEPLSRWFQHTLPDSNMQRTMIRDQLRHFTKVGVHYKDSHANSFEDGPFHCSCPPSVPMGCYLYKVCPVELACFLDCFRDLKEFYFIVEPRIAEEKKWAAKYKSKIDETARQLTTEIKVKKRGDDSKPVVHTITKTKQLAQFSDTKWEYIQHAPPAYMPEVLPQSPFSDDLAPRECLVKAMQVFKSYIGNQRFCKPLHHRRMVKFGMLIPYSLNQPETKST